MKSLETAVWVSTPQKNLIVNIYHVSAAFQLNFNKWRKRRRKRSGHTFGLTGSMFLLINLQLSHLFHDADDLHDWSK